MFLILLLFLVLDRERGFARLLTTFTFFHDLVVGEADAITAAIIVRVGQVSKILFYDSVGLLSLSSAIVDLLSSIVLREVDLADTLLHLKFLIDDVVAENLGLSTGHRSRNSHGGCGSEG